MPVSTTTHSSFSKNYFLAIICDLKKHLLCFTILDDCPERYLDIDIFTVFSSTSVFTSGTSVFSLKMFFELKMEQGPHILVATQDHMSSTTSISSVRTSFCDVFFPVQMHGTFTPVSG